MGDEISDIQWLLHQISAIEGCSATKARFITLIKAQAGKVIRFSRRELIQPDRVQRARQLLLSGTPVPVVRDRLMRQYQCSQVTAYSIIKNAKATLN